MFNRNFLLLIACVFVCQSSVPVNEFYSDTSTIWYNFNLRLNKQSFDKMAVKTTDVSSIGFFNEVSFQLVTV